MDDFEFKESMRKRRRRALAWDQFFEILWNLGRAVGVVLSIGAAGVMGWATWNLVMEKQFWAAGFLALFTFGMVSVTLGLLSAKYGQEGKKELLVGVVGTVVVILLIVILPKLSMTKSGIDSGIPPPLELPAFPWYPPPPSAFTEIPMPIAGSENGRIYGDTERWLRGEVESAGYSESNFYAVPGGFAMATKLEHINPDGTADMENRWEADVGPLQRFRLLEYLRVLFNGHQGFYRVMVFIVTPEPVGFDHELRPSRKDSGDWVSGGLSRLPSSLREQAVPSDCACTVCIYEFYQRDKGVPAVQIMNDGVGGLPILSGRDHLKAAGLFKKERDQAGAKAISDGETELSK